MIRHYFAMLLQTLLQRSLCSQPRCSCTPSPWHLVVVTSSFKPNQEQAGFGIPPKTAGIDPRIFCSGIGTVFFVLGMCFVFLFPCFFAVLRQKNLLSMLLFFFASPVLCFSALVFPRFFFSLLLCFFASLLLHCYTSLLFSAL